MLSREMSIRLGASWPGVTPAKFGALITADHVMLSSSGESSRKGYTTALFAQDPATVWIGCFPLQTKSAHGTKMGSLHLTRGDHKFGRVYTNGSGELPAAAHFLSWGHDVSTPQRPQSNCVLEQAVRRTLEGSRAFVLQAGIPPLWRDVAHALCAPRNGQGRL